MSDISLRYAAGQIVGQRNRQEDEYGVLALSADDPDAILVTVSDGMGGYAGGAEAAHAAVRGFMDVFESNAGKTADRLTHAITGANAAVRALKHEKPVLDSAGCTLVAALIENATVSWISVGDSSLFRLRDGTLERLNADHSMRPVLEEMVAVGRMTAEDVDANPNRNALRSAITGEDIELVDLCSDVALEPGDQLLLASDGLNVLSSARVAHLLEEMRDCPLQDTVTALLAAVEAQGAPRQDNTTAILYRMTAAHHAPKTSHSQRLHTNAATARSRLVLASGALLFIGIATWWLLAAGPGRVFAQSHGWHWFSNVSASARPASGRK